jgi:Derlin-2/3
MVMVALLLLQQRMRIIECVTEEILLVGFSVVLCCCLFCSFYNSLPPVSKSFGTLCVLTTLGYQLGVIKAEWLLLDFALVASKFQV